MEEFAPYQFPTIINNRTMFDMPRSFCGDVTGLNDIIFLTTKSHFLAFYPSAEKPKQTKPSDIQPIKVSPESLE